MAVRKSRKRSGFEIYSYCKNSAFTAVERDAKFCEMDAIFQYEVYKSGTFSVSTMV